ncbi:polyprenyl synthetase family protein [Mycobacterium kansasii]|uniref:Polyprenyl synthetase family protein n=1 Tax=Mycobacterium kansasii TaxID=1768 RepID=A0A1V3WF83_MYCKA|nr:polyprenyl synthetase family protein [Mycobacterium kansasii]
MFSGADGDQVERLSRLGGIVGTAFQIADDIIDIDSESDESGKVPGTDLREGVRTLPMLYALRDTGPTARGCVRCWPDPSTTTTRCSRRWRCCARRRGWPRPKTCWRNTPRRRATSWTCCPMLPAGGRWRRWSTTPSAGTASGVCRPSRNFKDPSGR